ncbi:rab11 family-interacting protein 1 isoform X4 [Gadus morhua]|uniref:rab11 family-interacting protein 1 isoform X4 n=1 Tax=Gadus morhua TaxID=8049 RepID=UPI0011B5CD77|nr:rab11 family-interacting protein 1-like isoform X4 [Gadus morhua]
MSLADQSQQWFPTSAQVTVLQARGLRIKGKNGTNDAYAIMQVAKDKFSTEVAEKSVAPMWKEQASFDLPPAHQGNAERGTLRVHVMHRALVGPDKPLGQAVVNLLDLHEVKSRNKTEWFKLVDKGGKADKERGEVLLDIQFMRNNMTASMFDLSGMDKSRSRLGKIKDKLRGKKKDGSGLDSVSAIVPSSFSQVLTDSEEEVEEEEEEEGAAGFEGAVGATKEKSGKKKLKLKSLFSHKSTLKKNMSQSMSFLGPLPERNQTLSGSRSSGLNVEPSEGKKKFKFGLHKRSGSNDSKSSQASASVADPAQRGGPDAPRPGGLVYTEEPTARAGSRASSTFSLSSSGRGSMEDLHRGSVEGSFSSYDSLRVPRPQPSPWLSTKAAEEGEVEEGMEEEEEEEEEVDVSEYEQRRGKQEEEKARQEEQMRIERRREEEEQRKRLDEERMRREELEKREIEEQQRKYQRDEEDRIRREREEEERFRREEVKRRELEEERERTKRMEEEEKFRMKEEMVRIEKERAEREEKERREEERTRLEKEEEEKMKREWEEKQERIRIEKERLEEEYERERVRLEKVKEEEEERRVREEEEEERRVREEEEEEERRVREEEEEEEEKMTMLQEREERRLREKELEDERFRMEKEERRVREEEEERLSEMQEREERELREKELEEERFRMREEEERRVREEEERKVREEEARMSEMQEIRLRERSLDEERFRMEKERGEEERRVREEEEEERMSDMQEKEERRVRERELVEERFRMEKEREEEERRVEEETTRIEKAKKRQEEERILMEGEERRRREVAEEEEQEVKRQEERERMRREESLLEEERIKRQEQVRREEDERVQEQQRREDERRGSEEEGGELEEEFMTKETVKNTPFGPPSTHDPYLGPNSALTNKSPGGIESARRRVPVRSVPPSEDDGPPTPEGPLARRTADVPTARQRSHPVKPLRVWEQQSAVSSVSATPASNTPSETTRGGRNAVAVKEEEARGPFSQLTRGELILLLQKLQGQLTQRDHKISELEQYIDNLLVRIMEEEPGILMSMNALKH